MRRPNGPDEKPKSRHSTRCHRYRGRRLEERKRKPVYFPNGLRTRHQSEAVDRGETSPCDLDLAEYQLAALGSRGAAFAGGKTDRFLKRLLPATSLLVQI